MSDVTNLKQMEQGLDAVMLYEMKRFLETGAAVLEMGRRVSKLEEGQTSNLEASIDGETLIIRKVSADTAAEAEE